MGVRKWVLEFRWCGTTSRQITSDHVTSRQITSDHVTSDHVRSHHVTSDHGFPHLLHRYFRSRSPQSDVSKNKHIFWVTLWHTETVRHDDIASEIANTLANPCLATIYVVFDGFKNRRRKKVSVNRLLCGTEQVVVWHGTLDTQSRSLHSAGLPIRLFTLELSKVRKNPKTENRSSLPS